MKILNTTFSKSGLENFEKLTRKEQKEYLKARNPLSLISEIERALKGVKYGKPTRITKKTKKSNKKQSSDESKGDNNERPDNNRSETE